METPQAVQADMTRHGCSWCAGLRINKERDRFELLRYRKGEPLFCSIECRDTYRETMTNEV